MTYSYDLFICPFKIKNDKKKRIKSFECCLDFIVFFFAVTSIVSLCAVNFTLVAYVVQRLNYCGAANITSKVDITSKTQ